MLSSICKSSWGVRTVDRLSSSKCWFAEQKAPHSNCLPCDVLSTPSSQFPCGFKFVCVYFAAILLARRQPVTHNYHNYHTSIRTILTRNLEVWSHRNKAEQGPWQYSSFKLCAMPHHPSSKTSNEGISHTVGHSGLNTNGNINTISCWGHHSVANSSKMPRLRGV